MTIALIIRHLGPGPHSNGSPQAVHGHEGVRYIKDTQPLDADKLRRKEFSKWWSTLSEPQRATLNSYQLAEYGYINSNLRHGILTIPEPGAQASPEQASDVVRVDKLDALINHPISEDTVVYRGMKTSEIGDVQAGDIYCDKGFCSTSLTRGGGLSFTSWSPNRVLCEIVVPKDTQTAVTKKPSEHSGEAEVLLGRNTRFNVVSVEKGSPGGPGAYIRLDVIREES